MSVYSVALGKVIQDDDWEYQNALGQLESPKQAAELIGGDLNGLIYHKKLIPIDREGRGGMFSIGDAAIIAAFLPRDERESVMEMIRTELVNALAEA